MSGLLGKAAPAADTNTVLYTVPADTVTTLSVLMVNRGVEPISVYLSVSSQSNPNAEDYIEYGVKLAANGGVLERTSLACSAGELVVVRASGDGVSVRVNGFEQVA